MPTLSDIRHIVAFYNPATLSFDLWDGTLQTGSLVIGAVTQSGTWNINALTSITNAVAVTGSFWQATQPVSGTVTANAGTGTLAVSGPLTDAQLRATAVSVSPNATPWADIKIIGPSLNYAETTAASALKVDGSAVTQPVSGTVNPATSFGKTVTYVAVNQSAAGSTQIVAASVGNKHKVLSAVIVLSALGTAKFTDGVGDLTGPMDIAANGGWVWPGGVVPYIETAATNRALNLVTTLGAARGAVAVLTET